MNLDTKVSELSGVGAVYVKRLEKIGIRTVRDLLFHFPRRYDDYSKNIPINQIKMGENVSVKGEVWEIKNKKSKRGITVTEAVIADDTGTLKAVWFNQPFLLKNIKQGDKIALAGKLEWSYGGSAMNSPGYEKLGQSAAGSPQLAERGGEERDPSAELGMTGKGMTHTGGIIPVYPETEGLTSKWLRFKIKPLLKLVDDIEEYLPEKIAKGETLGSIQDTVREMHFPRDAESLKKARDRVAFDEMFLIQLAVLSARKANDQDIASSIKFDEKLIKEFVGSLGFDLTDAQRKAAWEILKDLEKEKPMNRLLEGDVGSGKTIVAAIALLNAAKAGKQAVLLAPTEVLAKQHYNNLKTIFEGLGVSLGLLTRSNVILTLSGVEGEESRENDNLGRDSFLRQAQDKLPPQNDTIKKEDIYDGIKSGGLDILVGTHALLSEDIQFKDLGLVIVDEQHRFGVEQRSRLRRESGDKKTYPHFLSMTATPIPRSLTLTIYGDLDVSILDEMPKGRQKIVTRVVPPVKRNDAYGFIKKEVESGRQVFVICPLIEESDKLGVKSAESEYKKLKEKVFPDFRIGLLHGKLKSKEKEAVMNDFKNGKLDILVSTSVVEVGVDVPNATVMMIEGADRFGLAQLHQFRGRVGRGEHKSYCLLFTDSSSETTQERLESLVNMESGFDLAEKDLAIRGPGEVFGTSQHGLPDINMKNLMNIELIKKTRAVVGEFLNKNDLKDFPLLKDKVDRYNVVTTLE